MSLWNSLWASERFPGGSGLWRGGLWTSQRIVSLSDTAQVRQAHFSGGEQGAMYESRPVVDGVQVLWQDAAGTTPVTADGQVVGRRDDVSGNGNHIPQSTAGSKPVYRTDGTLHWLESDGIDDNLVLPIGMGIDESRTVVIASRALVAGQTAYMFADHNTGTSTAQRFCLVQLSGALASGVAGSQTTGVLSDSGAMQSQVYQLSVESGFLNPKLNISGTDKSITSGTSTTADPTSLYSRQNGAYGSWRDYGCMFLKEEALSGVGDAMEYYASLSGVTL